MKTNNYWEKFSTFFEQNKEKIFIFILFLVSLFIRRIGLRFGFPLLTHPDESPYVLEPVIHMTVNRTLDSGSYQRPDQILHITYFVYLNFLSLIRFGESIARTFSENQLFFYYYSRLLIAILGSIIPVVAYRIGKLHKIDFGVAAAIFFAFFPPYVHHSHYISPDIPITLFSLLVIYYSTKYLLDNENKFLYIATVFAAINTAEKYPGLLSLGIIIVAIVSRSYSEKFWTNIDSLRETFKTLLKAIVVYFLSMYLVAPNIFIEFGQVIQAILNEARTTHLGSDNLGWLGNLKFYFHQYVSATNGLMNALFFLGLLAWLKNKDRLIILLFYGFAYWLLMSKLALHWERWALPMYTAPLLISALGFAYLYELLKDKRSMRYMPLMVLLVASSHQFITSLSSSSRMAFTDTRVVALDYCNQHSISNENTLFEGYTPFIPQYSQTIFNTPIRDTANSKQYVILSSNMYQRYYNESDRYQDEVNYYEEIRQNFHLIKRFSPSNKPEDLLGKLDDIVFYFLRYLERVENDRFTGPVIEIYSTSCNN